MQTNTLFLHIMLLLSCIPTQIDSAASSSNASIPSCSTDRSNSSFRDDMNPHLFVEDSSFVDPSGLRRQHAAMQRGPSINQNDDSLHLQSLLSMHQIELPNMHIATQRIEQLTAEHSGLTDVLDRFRNPAKYLRIKYPTRMLFTGPSGSGKTTGAEALARYCGMTCLFVKGSSVGTTYMNSGSQFFKKFFECLIKHPENPYLVIVDELSTVTQFSDSEKDAQQFKTATEFWLGLDAIQKYRHICLVGTDNRDPEDLPEQLKTRFKYNTFHFQNGNVNTIIMMMKSILNKIDPSAASSSSEPTAPLHNCSDSFLHGLAKSVSHISYREIEELVEKSIAHALIKSDNPHTVVEEIHMKAIFNLHKDPTWYQQAWKERNLYLKSIVSPRALNLYLACTGIGLRFFTEKYSKVGAGLQALALITCALRPKAEHEANDLQMLLGLYHIFESHESHAQFLTSFNQQRDDRCEDKNLDNTRYDQQRKDREKDKQDQWLQFYKSHGLTSRADYSKHLKLKFNVLEENLNEISLIEDVNERNNAKKNLLLLFQESLNNTLHQRYWYERSKSHFFNDGILNHTLGKKDVLSYQEKNLITTSFEKYQYEIPKTIHEYL